MYSAAVVLDSILLLLPFLLHGEGSRRLGRTFANGGYWASLVRRSWRVHSQQQVRSVQRRGQRREKTMLTKRSRNARKANRTHHLRRRNEEREYRRWRKGGGNGGHAHHVKAVERSAVIGGARGQSARVSRQAVEGWERGSALGVWVSFERSVPGDAALLVARFSSSLPFRFSHSCGFRPACAHSRRFRFLGRTFHSSRFFRERSPVKEEREREGEIDIARKKGEKEREIVCGFSTARFFALETSMLIVSPQCPR